MKITNRDWLNTLPAETFYDILRHKRIELENKYLDTDFDSADTDEAVKYDFITWLESEHKAE